MPYKYSGGSFSDEIMIIIRHLCDTPSLDDTPLCDTPYKLFSYT